ncbi:MAG: carboxypeptidase regulatory-like domain-containing protein [Planctomycetes bacterium]|nr:carboxypeptidase regulatory-like domain-containing protein [Planctomycetota bacterium]
MPRPTSPSRPARARVAALLAVALGLVAGCGGGGGGSGGGGGGGGGGGVTPPPVVGPFELPDLAATPGAAPGQVVLHFTAPSPQASAYVVRARVRHLESEADVAAAAVVPHATTPAAPGTPETIVLSGLEQGQTLQWAVQVVRGAVTAPFGFAVACRVPAGAFAVPGNAITLTGPATLSQDGATYVLSTDVSTPGTAFTITGRDVTLDLGGHTVTYGTAAGEAYGVHAEYLYNNGTTTVRNGTIVQGAASSANAHGIWSRGGHHVRVTAVDVTVRGDDACCIVVNDSPTGDVRVDRCTLRCQTTVVTNRSYPGVAALYLEGLTHGLQVDHNLVLASPQWGIKVQGNATVGEATVHHNRVVGTKALVANGYMVGVYKPSVDVFENELAGESRGVHLDGVDGSGTSCRVHDNRVRVQDQPNAEYPDFHWVHGLKVEGASGSRLDRNWVTGTADATHAEVRAIDLDVDGTTGVVVERNRVDAVSVTETLRAHALQWTSGSSSATNDLAFRWNVMRATDRAIVRAWAARRGAPLRDNAWVRDLSLGPSHPFLFEYFDSSDALAAPDHRLVDAWTTEDVLAVDQWASPGPWVATREWTLTVVVVDDGGAPVPGASVTVRDASSTVVWGGTTDAQGRVAGTVVAHSITNGPTVSGRNPFSVSVSKSGVGSYAGPVNVTARAALRVDLAGGTAAPDTTPPPAPTGLSVHRVSASRLLARWDAATDPSGVAGYLVLHDGVLAAVTDENRAWLSGLPPATSASVTVVAVDRGGNASVPTAAGTATTAPEDRGP